ncbi:hypothetical protein CCR87_07995 [Rhodobaculum claviforme]|uniref:HTH-like domain-containing protein n=1 Tax=Rhodobaculum claviforme TaxID=1549854 RepID=A0A934TKH6_9RHOB|nr:hypothetical protein [Rhodobaculum claviforme]
MRRPICRVLPIAPTTEVTNARLHSGIPRAGRRGHNAKLREKIREVWTANRGLYGARKVWFALDRADVHVARCTVERWIARDGTARGGARQEGRDDQPRHRAPLPGRQGQPRLPRRATEPTVGRAIVRHWFENNGERFHVCSDLVGHGLVRAMPLNRWRAGPHPS